MAKTLEKLHVDAVALLDKHDDIVIYLKPGKDDSPCVVVTRKEIQFWADCSKGPTWTADTAGSVTFPGK